MHTPIQILPPLLANQIAAGEVVERPASIVKELVENSIDAGADEISVRVEEGGVRSICITDNGRGIPKEELILAVSPHATSKIYSLEDLENLQSMGFRGEALASISSVSRFTLKSRFKDHDLAYALIMEGKDEAPQIVPTQLHSGTTIIINDLFFNTPARRKFLKSTNTEFGHIEEVVRRIALAYPDISFSLFHQDKQIFKLPKAVDAVQQKERLKQICGNDFVNNMMSIEQTAVGLQVHGFLGKPTLMRASADLQYVYVNGRIVKDKLLHHAVKQAYKDVLYGDKHPALILFLEIDPRQVDVNVHPTKNEVRFRDGRLVHDFLVSSIQKTLASSFVDVGHDKGLPAGERFFDNPVDRQFIYQKTGESLPSQKELHLVHEFVAETGQQVPVMSEVMTLVSPVEAPVMSKFGKALAQLAGIFILAEAVDGLIVVDAHAAHERVLYERIKTTWQELAQQTQMLLLPKSVPLGPVAKTIILEHGELLRDLGFVVDELTEESIAVRAVPMILAEADLEHFFVHLAQDFELLGTTRAREDFLEQLLAEIACHSAVQAGQTLSLTQMNQLLQDMAVTPRIDQCNHGRPTWKKWSLAEFNQMFLRGR